MNSFVVLNHICSYHILKKKMMKCFHQWFLGVRHHLKRFRVLSTATVSPRLKLDTKKNVFHLKSVITITVAIYDTNINPNNSFAQDQYALNTQLIGD